MLRRLAITWVATWVAASSGCDEGSSEPDTTLGGAQQIFIERCTTGCHEGDRPQAGLSLEPGDARANVIDVPTQQLCQPDGIRVVPGDPDSSCMFQLVRDDVMPFFEEPLEASEKDIIEAWIAGGALQ